MQAILVDPPLSNIGNFHIPCMALKLCKPSTDVLVSFECLHDMLYDNSMKSTRYCTTYNEPASFLLNF